MAAGPAGAGRRRAPAWPCARPPLPRDNPPPTRHSHAAQWQRARSPRRALSHACPRACAGTNSAHLPKLPHALPCHSPDSFAPVCAEWQPALILLAVPHARARVHSTLCRLPARRLNMLKLRFPVRHWLTGLHIFQAKFLLKARESAQACALTRTCCPCMLYCAPLA